MPTDKVLIVVGIIEGHRFPRRPKHKLLVEAKFDGEILSTDLTDHVENPEFTTELAWESDKKTLHQHRLQRTPIKLQCFAVDMTDKKKEPIGYCILDLRSVQMQEFQQQKPQWHALLNSKYQKMKPEIKLIISFEDESQKMSTSASPNDKQISHDEAKENPESLHPVLDENEGHYILGRKNKATNLFCMSVTIATARNLPKLIPSNTELRQQDGFYFFYNLFENDVTSEPFFDIMNPEFPAERASVRIFTNLETLKQFIELNSSLQVHLCSGEHHLASTSISLKPLLMDELAANNPAKIEGLFPLAPPQSTPPAQGSNQGALLGVSIVLRIEKEEHPIGSFSAMNSVLAAGGDIIVPEHPFSPSSRQQQQQQKSSAEKAKNKKREKSPNSNIEKHEQRKTEIHAERGPKMPASGDDDDDVRAGNVTRVAENGRKRIQEDELTKGAPRHSQKPNQQKSNHYCYSIDLRSLKNMDIENPTNFYCRYSYPFFGSSSPILTSPAVEIRRNTDVLLPKSFCAFDFATSKQLLEQTLSRIPLVIEVWQRDLNRKDVIFGVSQINLSCIFGADKILVQSGNYRQIHSQLINVISPHSSKTKIGSLHVVLGLEDFGPVTEKPMTSLALGTTQSLLSASTTENTNSEMTDVDIQQRNAALPSSGEQQQRQNQQQQHLVEQRSPELPRDLPEYKAAIELEIWKEQQEEAFKNTLQQKELKLMQTLAEEWKKRDREREMILKRKVDEYNKLEEKLRTSIADLERREKQVAGNEVEVTRLRSDLLREHEQKLSFLRDASIRMKEDCDHRVELERLKLQEIIEQNQRYKEQLQLSEKRYKDKENEVLLTREQQMNRPESKLQAELNLAILEKAEQERKLDSVTKSNIHYKQQWGKALRELAKIKQNEQLAAKARLKKQERELEHMRLRYLAAEEKEVMKSEKEELENVKAELKRLQETQATPPQPQHPPQHQQDQTVANNSTSRGKSDQPINIENQQEDLFNNRIAKLIEERDTLLRTGVYSTDDKIIFELDRQIREAIASKDR